VEHEVAMRYADSQNELRLQLKDLQRMQGTQGMDVNDGLSIE
jgi:Tfp pilus assembly ATPase PilU